MNISCVSVVKEASGAMYLLITETLNKVCQYSNSTRTLEHSGIIIFNRCCIGTCLDEGAVVHNADDFQQPRKPQDVEPPPFEQQVQGD